MSDLTETPVIAPRTMNFTFDADIPRYWFGEDQFKTLLFTTLSCIFPEGERFFIQSVRHFQEGIEDPQLRGAVRGFIGQEAHHSKEHRDFNAFMRGKGIPVGIVEKTVKNSFALLTRWQSPQRRLAKTCALEHFIAMLGEVVLEHPEILQGIDARMEPLWLWHAIEESEHKAVAFDVYQAQVDRYGLRVSEMVFSTAALAVLLAVHYIRLQRASGLPTDWRSVRRGLRWLVGGSGWLRRLGSTYRAYYRRDFHPTQQDSASLRAQALERLAKLLDRPDLSPPIPSPAITSRHACSN